MISNESLKRSDEAIIKTLNAKPRKLVAKWSIGPLPPFPPLEFQQKIIDEMALLMRYEKLSIELHAEGLEALRHYSFEQLDEMADVYPDLAKKLANPNLTGLCDQGEKWK